MWSTGSRARNDHRSVAPLLVRLCVLLMTVVSGPSCISSSGSTPKEKQEATFWESLKYPRIPCVHDRGPSLLSEGKHTQVSSRSHISTSKDD